MSDDWKEQKKRQKAIFTTQQNLPYEVKVRRAELRAREFIQELDRRGMNAHVSEGGQREEALVEHGCNYFGKSVIRSAPFAPFLRQDGPHHYLPFHIHLEHHLHHFYDRTCYSLH
jgi:hypothetical protein